MAQGHDLVTVLRNEESPFHVVVSDVRRRASSSSHIERFQPDAVVVRGNPLAAYVPLLRASNVFVVFDSDYAFADAITTMASEDSNRARGLAWRHAAKVTARIEAATVGLVDEIWCLALRVARLVSRPYPTRRPSRSCPTSSTSSPIPPSHASIRAT